MFRLNLKIMLVTAVLSTAICAPAGADIDSADSGPFTIDNRAGKQWITFVDPYPSLMKNGKVTITDPERLGSYAGRHATGLTADGVTPVLIRVQVCEAGTMEFNLRDEYGNPTDVGTLSTPGGSEEVTTLEVPVNELSDGRYIAFAVLTAPPAFFRGLGDEALLERPITVETNYYPSECSNTYPDSCDVKLIRPLVIMVHGLWSDSSAFTSLSTELYNNGFVYRSRHSYNNRAGFATNDWVLPHLINNALINLRTAGYACTKVDIVAHSMGGLLAKRIESSFAQKTVRKIITIGSPYQGSPAADMAFELRQRDPNFFNQMERIFNHLATGGTASLTGGAVWDLRTEGAGNPYMPVSAEIPGVDCRTLYGYRDGSSDVMMWTWIHYFMRKVTQSGLLDSAQTIHDRLFGPDVISDWIVSQESQIGNSTLSTPVPVTWHCTESQDSDFMTFVIDWLNEPAQPSRATESLTFEHDIMVESQKQSSSIEKSRLEKKIVSIATEPNGTVEIITPTEGQTCVAGGSITISVQGTGDTSHAGLVAFFGTSPWSDIVELPWEGEVNIPSDTVGSAGQIIAMGLDANMGMTAVDEVNAILDSNVVLESIFLGFGDKWTFDFKTFPQQSHEFQLYPMGIFSDGSEHPLSVLAEPTVYETADVNIATVDANGLITVNSSGITQITVTCSTKTAYLQIEVDDTTGDLDLDEDTDFVDYALFANYWMNENCVEPDWCNGADFDERGQVDILDLTIFVEHWLEGTADGNVVDDPCMVWVYIDDGGSVPPGMGFHGEMSKYETTNVQYCMFLNAALATGDITVNGNNVLGASGSNSGADFVGEVYYTLDGPGYTFDGATNGGAARINYGGGVFSVDSGFESHPVTYVSWYGATAFCNYYGCRLPTMWEWFDVADYDGSYTYGCGPSINNSIANYRGSTHPHGTTAIGAFGTYGYGMCDMAGNVWEWTSDAELHSGSWDYLSQGCAVSYGLVPSPDNTDYRTGFRACR